MKLSFKASTSGACAMTKHKASEVCTFLLFTVHRAIRLFAMLSVVVAMATHVARWVEKIATTNRQVAASMGAGVGIVRDKGIARLTPVALSCSIEEASGKSNAAVSRVIGYRKLSRRIGCQFLL